MVHIQAVFNVDINGLYLVQSLDCGVHHHYDTTTAVPSYTLVPTAEDCCTVTYSYTHYQGKLRTGSGKYIKKKERKWKLQQSVSKILHN